MTRRWRPTPDEERWLAVVDESGAARLPSAVAERTGGWRSTGMLARIALFVLGVIAAALLLGLLGFRTETTLLIAGLIAALAAESLIVTRRLFASGIEEGLCVAGWLMIGGWLTTLMNSAPVGTNLSTLILIAAAGAAGLRLLNPLVTTCAVIAFVYWAGPFVASLAPDRAIGEGAMTLFIGGTLAALALLLGGREFRRPSHDRMLDWMVATLPVATYSKFVSSMAWYEPLRSPGAGEFRLGVALLLISLGAAMLITGLRRRRHAPLLGFLGCVVCLAFEVRLATTLATETWLIVYGLAALLAGVGLERYLREPRNGFTSAALTSRQGPLDLLQTAGAAVLAHRTAPEAPAPEAAATGGGGRFGGGGASGSF